MNSLRAFNVFNRALTDNRLSSPVVNNVIQKSNNSITDNQQKRDQKSNNSITDNRQKRDQIELEYDQDVLECNKYRMEMKIAILQSRTLSYDDTDFYAEDINLNHVSCIEIAKKSKELKLAKLN